jgi:hypothetical protein
MDIPLGTSCVGTDDDGVLPSGDLLLDICSEDRLGEEIIDGDIEESLNLRGVQVKGNDVICASNSEQVGNEPTKMLAGVLNNKTKTVRTWQ